WGVLLRRLLPMVPATQRPGPSPSGRVVSALCSAPTLRFLSVAKLGRSMLRPYKEGHSEGRACPLAAGRPKTPKVGRPPLHFRAKARRIRSAVRGSLPAASRLKLPPPKEPGSELRAWPLAGRRAIFQITVGFILVGFIPVNSGTM